MLDLYKVTFKCEECDSVLKIDFNSLIEAKTIVCPSCSSPLPDDALRHLSKGLQNLKSAVHALNLNQEATIESRWSFALKIDYITNR